MAFMPSASTAWTSAPAFAKQRTASAFPSREPHSRGVSAPLSLDSLSAPESIRNCTTWASPPIAASVSVERPAWSVASSFAPFSTRNSTMARLPCWAAKCSAVISRSPRSSKGAPFSTRSRASSSLPCTTMAATMPAGNSWAFLPGSMMAFLIASSYSRSPMGASSPSKASSSPSEEALLAPRSCRWAGRRRSAPAPAAAKAEEALARERSLQTQETSCSSEPKSSTSRNRLGCLGWPMVAAP
mmetsp:Transcript_37950/g.109503  ORF Transcript_37950/g.109503 Transcript_37950/m.109503 type:complete len:243 (-) Transcript_37950:50-778(-)